MAKSKKKKESGRIIFLDSSVVIPLLQSSHGNHSRITNCISEEVEAGSRFMMCHVVVSEILSGIDEKDWSNILSILQEDFEIVDFDLDACLNSARIFRHLLSKMPKKIKAKNLASVALKADLKILASAIKHGATEVLAEDGGFLEVGKNINAIKGLSGNSAIVVNRIPEQRCPTIPGLLP
jgi:predicted nucleic acid-binding protein